MNNSEDLAPESTYNLPRPRLLPPLFPDLQAAVPHSTFRNLFVSSRPGVCVRSSARLFARRPAQLLHSPFHPLRGSFAYLNARAIRYSSFDLSFTLVSDARFSRESLDSIGPVFRPLTCFGKFIKARCRCESWNLLLDHDFISNCI